MEQRITDLEIKLMHAESHIESLNNTVFEQQKLIDDMNRQLELMREYIQSIGKQMSQIATPGEEAPPPHY